MSGKTAKTAHNDNRWHSNLAERFDAAKRSAREELAIEMGESPDFFDTDPHAIDKMLAFMVKKGVITITERPKDSLCRAQQSPGN
jgi:hypothetical protein